MPAVAASLRSGVDDAWQRLRRWPPDPAVALFAASSALLLVWWIAVYPGLISPDSVTYALQATGRIPFDSAYSVFYNSLLWLSFKISGGFALLIFVQVICMAAALTYCATGVHKLGARWRWLAIAVIAMCVLPTGGAFTTYLSKDTAFAIAEIYTLGTITRLIRARLTDAAARVHWRLWVALFLGFVLMCLFRDNSAIMVAIAAAFLVIALPGLRLRVVIAAACAILAWVVLMFGVYPAAGVKKADSSLVLGPAYADIAIVYQKAPHVFSQADLDLMSQETPLSRWKSARNCYTSDTLDVNRAWNRAAGRRNAKELFQLWRKVFRNQPNIVIDTRICRGAIAWMPFAPAAKTSSLLPLVQPSNLPKVRRLFRPADYHAMKPDPPSSLLRHGALWVEKATFAHDLEGILYRGATWAYLAYLAVFLYIRRQRVRASAGFALVSIIMANQFTVFIDNPNQLIRYMLGCLFMGALLGTLLSSPRTLRPG